MKEKKMIGKGLLFLLLLGTLIFLINILYVNQVLTYNVVYRQDVQLREFVSKNDVLNYAIVGDSHAVVALNPSFIPGSFNLATHGEKYGKNYFKLKHLLEEDDLVIKHALLELDMHTFLTLFDADPNWQNDLYLVKSYIPSSELTKVYNLNSTNFFFVEKHFPFFGHTEEFGYLFKEPPLEQINNGWIKDERQFYLTDTNAEAERKYQAVYTNQSRISNLTFPYFLQTLELLKKHNVSIVFITYPVSKEYAEILEKNNVEKEEYYSFIFKQVNKTLEDYYYFDYYDLYFENSTLFADSDHLNYVGAEHFSKKVFKDLQTIS